MSFLAVLIALLVDQGLPHLQALRDARWFHAYSEPFLAFGRSSHVPRATLAVVLLVILPAVVALFVGDALDRLWDGLGFVFATVVFWFCLGPKDLHPQVEAYMDALQAGDETKAAALAAEILGRPAPAAERTQALTRAVFVEAHARLFGVLFWFGLLGPGGALMYRCAEYLRRMPLSDTTPEFQAAVERLHGVLAWLPAHLTALGYGLGNLEDTISDLKTYYHGCLLHFFQVSDDVLSCAGLAAIRGSGEDGGVLKLKSALSLVLRTLVIWLVIFGLLTLFGWSW